MVESAKKVTFNNQKIVILRSKMIQSTQIDAFNLPPRIVFTPPDSLRTGDYGDSSMEDSHPSKNTGRHFAKTISDSSKVPEDTICIDPSSKY